jgi:ribosomal protein S18 acetylase RimI-like enzyme
MIRQATQADLSAIESIVTRAYSKYLPRIGAPPGPMLDDYVARIAANEAFVTGTPVRALIVLVDAPDHLLLDNIAVDPAAQGTGQGRILMEFADAEARRRGHAELRLYTHQTMVENIALYTRLGWMETGRGVQSGLARVFFRKTLG